MPAQRSSQAIDQFKNLGSFMLIDVTFCPDLNGLFAKLILIKVGKHDDSGTGVEFQNRFGSCNSIHAGAIDTPMVHSSFEQLGLGEVKPDRKDAAVPVGVGRPEDVANLVLFLASDESRFINGAELLIDNGLIIQ